MVRRKIGRAEERGRGMALRAVACQHMARSRPRHDRRRADKTLSGFVASDTRDGGDHRVIHRRAGKRSEVAGGMTTFAGDRSGGNVISRQRDYCWRSRKDQTRTMTGSAAASYARVIHLRAGERRERRRRVTGLARRAANRYVIARFGDNRRCAGERETHPVTA